MGRGEASPWQLLFDYVHWCVNRNHIINKWCSYTDVHHQDVHDARTEDLAGLQKRLLKVPAFGGFTTPSAPSPPCTLDLQRTCWQHLCALKSISSFPLRFCMQPHPLTYKSMGWMMMMLSKSQKFSNFEPWRGSPPTNRLSTSIARWM